jgi:hypothetical protein
MNIELKNRKKEVTGYAIVSPEDYEHLNQYKWCKNKNYITGNINNKKWMIHRYIIIELLKYELTSKNLIDHINNNPLDNRRENLRIVNYSENARNKNKKQDSTSEYIGVCKRKDKESYYVKIRLDNKRLSAEYKKEIHAAYQYNLWIDEYNIVHAKKNSIEIPDDFIEYKSKELPLCVFKKNNKFEVKICVNYKRIYIGVYNTLEEAIENRDNAIENKNKEIQDKLLNMPILYNKDNQSIFKIKKIDIIIDEDLYYDIIKYKWCKNKNDIRTLINNKQIALSRYIMNYKGENYVDHINNNPLDNRKCNLRIVTPEQNNMNKSSHKNSSSKYIGVYWHKQNKKWQTSITFKGNTVHLGTFEDEIEAAKARDIATLKYFGEHGNLNFKEN